MSKRNVMPLPGGVIFLALILVLMPSLTAQVSRVFRSTNGGVVWPPMPVQGLPNQRILALAVARTTPTTLYVGTGQRGVYKSTDGGAHWQSAGLAGKRVLALAVLPTNPATLYAGTLEDGLHRSTNGGASWTQLRRFGPRGAFAIAIDARTPAAIYASAAGRGIYKSMNQGDDWAATGRMRVTLEGREVINPTVQTIVIDANTIYAGTLGGGVFKSTNGGTAWAPFNTGLTNLHVLALAHDPGRANTIYAGTGGGAGLYKSTNGGVNWALANRGLGQGTVGFLSVSATDTLYAGTLGGGVFKSSDGAANWSSLNLNLENNTIVVDALAIDPANVNNVYTCILDGQQRDFPVGSDPRAAVVADFNLDSFPDLAVANYGSDTVSILLWAEKLFANPVELTTGAAPEGIALADFNGDGIKDLAVVNRMSNSLSIFIGNARAAFTPLPPLDNIGNGPSAIVAADFDGDGINDLAVANADDNTVSILFGSGTGTFVLGETVTVGAGPRALAVDDLNLDGIADLAVANADDGTVSILLGKGDGTFSKAQPVVVGAGPSSVAIAGYDADTESIVDFNRDNVPDLAVANAGDNTVTILLGNGDGTFGKAQILSVGTAPSSVAIGDFNGDRIKDLAVANAGDNTVSIRLGKDGGPDLFEDSGADLAVGNAPWSVTVGRFNSGLVLDLAVANAGSDNVSILLGKGDGAFHEARDFVVGSAPHAVIAGDLNRNGHDDLVVANSALDSNSLSVLLWESGSFVTPAGEFPVGPNPTSVAAGDFNADNKPDLAVTILNGDPARDNGRVSILLGDGAGGFTRSPVVVEVGRNPASVAVADFDGDKIPDLAVAHAGTLAAPGPRVSILLGNGDGTFDLVQNLTVGPGPNFIAIDDFNDDKIPDLAVANGGSNTISVLLGNGDGTFDLVQSPTVGLGPSSIAVGDFDADGVPDLAVANAGTLAAPGNTVSILLGNGDGTFEVDQPISLGASRRPVSIAAIDYDQPVKRYLAVVNQESSDLSILIRRGDSFALSDRAPGVFCRPAFVTAARFDLGAPALAITGLDRQLCAVVGAQRAALDAEDSSGVLSIITAVRDCRPPCKIRDWGGVY